METFIKYIQTINHCAFTVVFNSTFIKHIGSIECSNSKHKKIITKINNQKCLIEIQSNKEKCSSCRGEIERKRQKNNNRLVYEK